MADFSRTSVLLDVEEEAAPSRRIDSDSPFRIFILGDFSGRANRGPNSGLSGRRPLLVDLDNFDDVMETMQPSLRLPRVDLRFRELDDFHPDHIYRNAELFRKLAELRYEPPKAATAGMPVATGPGLLDSILEQTGEATAPGVEEAGDLAAFIRKVTAPHVEARPDAARLEWESRKEAAISEQMRAVLHHPQFQAAEAAWRATWLLVRGLADDVKIHLLDATLDELMSDLPALEKLLAAPRDPWALLVGNYVFGESQEDARRLSLLGKIARAVGAPFLAEAQPPAAEPAAEHWQDLRRSPVARWIGLVLPRFLLRLPYGKATSPVESFAFEEMSGSVHAEYLWGNPAFCCAYLIGQSFRSHGWELRPGMHRQVSGLPLHVYTADGQAEIKPCAEVLLSENDAELLLDCGYMPLASMKNKDAVMLVRFQSIADPLTPLAGRWTA